jgi:hypothetical protein
MLRLALCVAIVIVGSERPAQADLGALVKDSATTAVARTRRSLALGPTVGVGGAYAFGPDAADLPVTFGLAFRRFDIPWLPDRGDVTKMVIDRAREGGAVTDMVKDVGGELLGRVTGRRPRPPRTLEKPKLAITIEGARWLDSGDWEVRASAGLGLSKITLGPAVAGHFGDADGVLVGAELGLHLTPWDGVRSPVVDLYLRGELGVTSQVDDVGVVTVGTRFLYDLI